MLSPTSTQLQSQPRQRIQVRGVERFMVWTPETCFMVVHTMLLHDSSPSSTGLDALLRHLPQALLHTFNRHPRMRARLVADEFATAEIHDHLTLDDIAAQLLLQIENKPNMEADKCGSSAWQLFIQERARTPIDRFNAFPFELHAWVDHAAHKIRLTLFSDHYMSDGKSGATILNDVLATAATLSRDTYDTTALLPRMPLRGSVYEQSFHSRTWMHPLLRTAMSFGAKALIKLAPPFSPLIKPRSGHAALSAPPPINASTMRFATGSRPSLERLVQRCREEKTTFFGALTAAIIVGFASVVEAPSDAKFNIKLALGYDMRKRMTEPVEEETVGFYSLSGMIEQIMEGGGVVPQQTGFWAIARAAKQEADAAQNSAAVTTIAPLLMDQCYHSQVAASFFEDLPKDEFASVGDALVSSVGHYKHSTTHTFGSCERASELAVESLHFNCRSPFIAPLSQFYVTSVPNGIGYGFSSHLDDEVGVKVLDAVVRVMESAWRVGENDSLAQVADSCGTKGDAKDANATLTGN